MHTERVYLKISPEEFDTTTLAELIQDQSSPLWFTAIDFSGQDLSRINLQGMRFERCLFAGSNLTAAKLDNTEWLNCRAAQAIFRSATLVDAKFSSSDLNNTQWQHSKLAHASFEGCKLTGANFVDAATLGLNFSDCVLRSACLSGLSFYKSKLRGLDFADADLSYCDFRQAEFLEGGSLSMARVNNARFDQADLREASLDGLRLVDAKLFKGAIISKSQASMLLSGLGLTVM
ncbi:pentapeptide repeat-containing protein [Pseudomonas sp. PB120]|uniref:pentapeptide repeat-containing protein n=1 Tax=Pseudomonas sp. PB120 TaxID=2494700 RepID=UPI0012FE2AA2|nr:pentapeptide repeat-containing protein [Pseudomonas sp. PB120]MVV50810.1 pentapeptide repeat-containing protein [Pseudomonas sp. PB120]